MSELADVARGTGRAAREARRTLKRRSRAAGSDANDFAPLIDRLDDLTRRMAAPERRKLSRDIATDLRTENARRIRANVTPAGEPMVPRKNRANGKARTRRLRDELTKRRALHRGGRMFLRATAPRYLRKESSQGQAQVGFVGAMARIMRVHQEGLTDTVTRDPSSPAVVYPARPVLGMTPDDRLRILALVEQHVQP